MPNNAKAPLSPLPSSARWDHVLDPGKSASDEQGDREGNWLHPLPGIAHCLLARFSSAIRNQDARGSFRRAIQVAGSHQRGGSRSENDLKYAISSASVRYFCFWCAVPRARNRKFFSNWRIAAQVASEVRAFERISFICSAHLCATFFVTFG